VKSHNPKYPAMLRSKMESTFEKWRESDKNEWFKWGDTFDALVEVIPENESCIVCFKNAIMVRKVSSRKAWWHHPKDPHPIRDLEMLDRTFSYASILKFFRGMPRELCQIVFGPGLRLETDLVRLVNPKYVVAYNLPLRTLEGVYSEIYFKGNAEIGALVQNFDCRVPRCCIIRNGRVSYRVDVSDREELRHQVFLVLFSPLFLPNDGDCSVKRKVLGYLTYV